MSTLSNRSSLISKYCSLLHFLSFFVFYRKGCSDFFFFWKSVESIKSFWQFFVSRCDGGSDMLGHACWLFGEPFRCCFCRCWPGDAIRSRSVRLKPLSLMTLHYLHIHRYTRTIIRWLCQLSARFLSRYLLSYYDIFRDETLQVYYLRYVVYHI